MEVNEAKLILCTKDQKSLWGFEWSKDQERLTPWFSNETARQSCSTVQIGQ